MLTYSSFADAENTWSRILSDPALAPALGQWHKPMDPGYARSENMLLRAFAGHPQLRIPPATREGHIFELRTYESNNEQTLRRKIDMFNGGETQIFQRVGLQPVFFGETLVGSRLPNLTYMLSYKDLATRESVWKAFEADSEWKKLRARPGLWMPRSLPISAARFSDRPPIPISASSKFHYVSGFAGYARISPRRFCSIKEGKQAARTTRRFFRSMVRGGEALPMVTSVNRGRGPNRMIECLIVYARMRKRRSWFIINEPARA